MDPGTCLSSLLLPWSSQVPPPAQLLFWRLSLTFMVACPAAKKKASPFRPCFPRRSRLDFQLLGFAQTDSHGGAASTVSCAAVPHLHLKYGKTTCPATMQRLSSFDLRPNHTLKSVVIGLLARRRLLAIVEHADVLPSVLAGIEATPFKENLSIEVLGRFMTDFSAFRTCEDVLAALPISDDASVELVLKPECMTPRSLLLLKRLCNSPSRSTRWRSRPVARTMLHVSGLATRLAVSVLWLVAPAERVLDDMVMSGGVAKLLRVARRVLKKAVPVHLHRPQGLPEIPQLIQEMDVSSQRQALCWSSMKLLRLEQRAEHHGNRDFCTRAPHRPLPHWARGGAPALRCHLTVRRAAPAAHQPPHARHLAFHISTGVKHRHRHSIANCQAYRSNPFQLKKKERLGSMQTAKVKAKDMASSANEKVKKLGSKTGGAGRRRPRTARRWPRSRPAPRKTRPPPRSARRLSTVRSPRHRRARPRRAHGNHGAAGTTYRASDKYV
ncbi:hypothetical protein HU200_049692 [Digitaria exilis]|uniref:U-box domain-containing protein n=1 Tax=Digitaria exilis TaxID=1010633 RepID=A0A835AT67_9POAL|nr:hypothetical protein HU200_049692 [Digitaria exilis]